MKRRIKALLLGTITALSLLTACGQAPNQDVSKGENKTETKTLTFGVAPGPYGDMIAKAIQPSLEQKGYKIELKEFSDYVQPNLALANKEIDANLFQHAVYLDKFSKDHNLKLTPVISVPTAGVGAYSNKIKSLNDLKEGSQVTLSNDPTNLARGLRFLQAEGLITLKKEIDPTKASEKDIAENSKKLKFAPIEAAQIPRSLDSTDVAVINGNFAIAAGIPLSSALALEKLDEKYKNIVAVRTEDVEAQFAKDIKEAIESDAFKKVIEDPQYMFKDFQKPDWYKK